MICQCNTGSEGITRNLNELREDVDYFVSKGVKRINIYGGEPFLNKNMPEILAYISQFDMECCISSNARVFSSMRFVEELKKLKKARVITTLFSHDQKIHDCLTGTEGSFCETVQGIKNLLGAGIPVLATTVLTKKNLPGLKKTVEFLQQLGVTKIKISGLVDEGLMRERHDLVPDFASVKREIKRATALCGGGGKLLFEKLPLCVASPSSFHFIHGEECKKSMLICPDSEECAKCPLKERCMCS